MNELHDFYKNKKVLVTGHTGFKGTWLCNMLLKLEAKVYGYALKPPTNPSLFDILSMDDKIESFYGDIRDLNTLMECFQKVNPDIVIHMAAQPLVRVSYENPVFTYETNVMGTVNVLECVRNTRSVKSVINVTTDKVYLNEELNVPFSENDRLCGKDPYSNSKSCSELVTFSYINSFFDNDRNVAISTCRAGNVIGGGDFAADRIIPDCYRAAINGDKVVLRNPKSIRPFQHVLEPLYAYLYIAMKQYENSDMTGNYNIGPDLMDCVTVEDLTNVFVRKWNELDCSNSFSFEKAGDLTNEPKEAGFLRLDNSLIKEKFGLYPKWNIKEAVERSAELYFSINKKSNITDILFAQIDEILRKEA